MVEMLLTRVGEDSSVRVWKVRPAVPQQKKGSGLEERRRKTVIKDSVEWSVGKRWNESSQVVQWFFPSTPKGYPPSRGTTYASLLWLSAQRRVLQSRINPGPAFFRHKQIDSQVRRYETQSKELSGSTVKERADTG